MCKLNKLEVNIKKKKKKIKNKKKKKKQQGVNNVINHNNWKYRIAHQRYTEKKR